MPRSDYFTRWLTHTFSRYASIGIVNTAIHWLTFIALYTGMGLSQAQANLGAFVLAVSFSFLANAKYTFYAKASLKRYLAFIFFMGILSYLTGWCVAAAEWHPLITLVGFSAISLVAGYLFSRFVIFRYK